MDDQHKQPADSNQHVQPHHQVNPDQPPQQAASHEQQKPPAHEPIRSYNQQFGNIDQRKKLPLHFKLITGLYVLTALYAFLSGAVSDLNGGNEFLYFTIGFVSLLIAVGLVLRFKIARKIAIGISIFAIAGYGIGIFGMLSLQQKVKDLEKRYNVQIAEVREQGTTAEQEKQINQLDAQIKREQSRLSGILPLFYSSMIVNIAINALFLTYLMMPKVKKLFMESASYKY